MAPSSESGRLVEWIQDRVKKDFQRSRAVLSFEEYLAVVAEDPVRQLRGSAGYLKDALDHFGSEGTGDERKFKIFDDPVDGATTGVIGHARVQNQIYRALESFTREGINNKLLLLHGPNGSAKSTLVHALMQAMERYSEAPEGAAYSFGWIFPNERTVRGPLGLQNGSRSAATASGESYAHLAQEDIATRLSSDLRDHPILLLPQPLRLALLEKLLGAEKAQRIWGTLPHYLRLGELSHQNRQIFDALLQANQGSFQEVLRHVQVERMYHSRRYRRGLVTIEPQMHVDAQYQLLSLNKNLSALPPALQSLSFFQLSGDLIDANRGIVEYSDLLKRPLDSFKYLLIACETGAVNVGTSIAYLDTLLLGSSNALQLDAFKEFPDFSSFKARIELIRVPYLTRVSEEEKIYASALPKIAGTKSIAPHTAWTAALWSVLTRLKKPNALHYAPGVSTLVGNLTPLEKAKLYDHEELPEGLSADDRKLLRSAIDRLREEYSMIPYYEGRTGASAREMKSVLFDAAQHPESAALSPLSVLRALDEFVRNVTEYEFLKQDVKDGYHDARGFVQTVRDEYAARVDREVRDSMGLYETRQWEEFLKRYVFNLSHFLKNERIRNTITGKDEAPDLSVIRELEAIVGAPNETETDSKELANFRQSVLTQLGAWSIDHPGQPMNYAKVFPEFWRKLEKHFFESQKALLTKMSDAVAHYGGQHFDSSSEGGKLAQLTIDRMVREKGYTPETAREVIIFLMKARY